MNRNARYGRGWRAVLAKNDLPCLRVRLLGNGSAFFALPC